MSVPSSILMVKNLHLTNKMLERFLVLWMFHRVSYVSVGPVHSLMWSISLSTKFMAMMTRTFLHLLVYSFLVDSCASLGGGLLDLFTMSQRTLVANTISILNFQRTKLSPLNLSTIGRLSLVDEAMWAECEASTCLKYSNASS